MLCYTEILGGIHRRTLAAGEAKRNFDTFFRELGPEYAQLLDDGYDIYGWFRCGMAHEYLIKRKATVAMLRGETVPSGVWIDAEGHRFVCIERYFDRIPAAAPERHHRAAQKRLRPSDQSRPVR